MIQVNADSRYHDWLHELTALPTAAGREERVIQWIRKWAARRSSVKVKTDRFGNLMLHRGGRSQSPILFAAHMDHPAFVVCGSVENRTVVAEFRGGVRDEYFIDSPVLLHRADGERCAGRVIELIPASNGNEFKRARIEFNHDVQVAEGDIITWDVGPATMNQDRFEAPACDDLAAVAAALAAFDQLGKGKAKSDVRILLTRAEEVGFIGAIGACESGIIPKRARIVALENSKSFEDSPIGGGPIVRVGDRLSTFDNDLTVRIADIAQARAGKDDPFRWQRKLMAGGACEATAYQCFDYRATCLCLPLGNYHNMDEVHQRIAPEHISISDFDNFVKLLVDVGNTLDQSAASSLRQRLASRFDQLQYLLR